MVGHIHNSYLSETGLDTNLSLSCCQGEETFHLCAKLFFAICQVSDSASRGLSLQSHTHLARCQHCIGLDQIPG